MYTTTTCKTTDIKRIRDFLVARYKGNHEMINYHIDRLNFTYSMSRNIHDVSAEEYRNRIRLYEDENNEILALVITEGENKGEVFFLFQDNKDIDDEILTDMFAFAEENLTITNEAGEYLNLRIPQCADKMREMAIDRGYKKHTETEPDSMMELMQLLDDSLPQGYTYKYGDILSANEMVIGHAKAFGYFDRKDLVENATNGAKTMREMIDYDPLLDINIVNEDGEVVAFATIWYDNENKIGILEPVGTHPDYRKLGLAKCAVYHACNKVFMLGAKKVYVGSDQEFYKRIGFEVVAVADLYKYTK